MTANLSVWCFGFISRRLISWENATCSGVTASAVASQTDYSVKCVYSLGSAEERHGKKKKKHVLERNKTSCKQRGSVLSYSARRPPSPARMVSSRPYRRPGRPAASSPCPGRHGDPASSVAWRSARPGCWISRTLWGLECPGLWVSFQRRVVWRVKHSTATQTVREGSQALIWGNRWGRPQIKYTDSIQIVCPSKTKQKNYTLIKLQEPKQTFHILAVHPCM